MSTPLHQTWSRRDFLQFIGQTALTTALPVSFLGCSSAPLSSLPFKPIQPSTDDQLLLAEGFHSQILISWQDALTPQLKFGFNNDYTAFFPFQPTTPDEGVLWVNHESVNPLFITGWASGQVRQREDVIKEMKEVGGSLVHIVQKDGRWQVVKNSKFNRRLDAHTPIPFVSARPIAGQKVAMGTLANCAGGVTPWGTLLTCEENYDNCYGELNYSSGKATWKPGPDYIYWRDFFPTNSPEHYGWVVEVNPFTGAAKKLTALGRFCHESATVVVARDGRSVVYSGDDHNDECLYKFIATKPGSLEQGELFAANIESGRWLPLNWNQQPLLQKHFKDQTEVLIRARDAAHLLGASRLDRPEDVEIHPTTGAVFVTLTNNKDKKNYHGSILKIVEDQNDYLSMSFNASTFLTGGRGAQFTCPDNMVFDRRGNLWLTNDVSDQSLNRSKYKGFGNNSLFYIPMSGAHAGRVLRVASAPVTAELTGPSFSPDGKTLFLSVQHPGENSDDRLKPTSHWPLGGNNMPKPSVVTISGPALDSLIA
ncbi:MAG: PhoX family phosphatase [Bdellovibrionales bacterium]